MLNIVVTHNEKYAVFSHNYCSDQTRTTSLQIKKISFCVQMVISDELPEKVGPGEKLYVVVDGVAYRIVNDDGSDYMSTSDAPSMISKSGCESETDVARLLIGLSGSEVPKEQEPKIGDELDGSLNDSKSGDVVNDQQQRRTVLAAIDDEFAHLSTDVFKSASDGSLLSSAGVPNAKPATLMNSFLNLGRDKSRPPGTMSFERPRLPKFVVQPRPQMQLRVQCPTDSIRPAVSPLAASVVSKISPVGPTARPEASTVRSVNVLNSSTTSASKHQMATSVIRSNGSEKVANDVPPVSDVRLPTKKATVEKTATSAEPVKPSRPPRTLKRMTLLLLLFSVTT